MSTGVFFPCIALLALPRPLISQQASSTVAIISSATLPEAPQPQLAPDADTEQDQQTQTPQTQTSPQPAPPAPAPAAQGSSSSQAGAQQSDTESQRQKAEEQIKEQEKQRTLGVIPAFNISYRSDAVSLTAGQKMRLAFHSSVDPVAFAAAFLVAGYHEALDDDTGFGWGWKGYGKRSGAAYLDAFDGTIIGNGILPAVLHQDPRYFRLGHGTTKHRILYALSTNVMCKHDNTHKWEPNYSNVAGNIISGAISNLYYPSSNSGIGQTITNGLTVTAEGGFGSLFQEFWPDISRRFLHKDPTHGLDAQARAQDAADKKAREDAKQPEPPSPKWPER
ncbi:MAG: hypothetical protein ACLPY1_19060 [Terracidiphilus sp.]